MTKVVTVVYIVLMGFTDVASTETPDENPFTVTAVGFTEIYDEPETNVFVEG